jgi:hypothetical protein
VKVRLAGLVVLAALLFVIVPVRGPLPAHASHTFSPTLLWPDLHAAGDHTIGYATCPQSYPTTWLNGIEQSWDAILPAWDFYQVNGCNSNVILDWEGQFGSCEAPPPNGINRLIRKSSTGEIFFVTNEGEFGLATKRYVMNGTTLGCLFPGIPWIEASDFEADSHPTGTPIQIPAC